LFQIRSGIFGIGVCSAGEESVGLDVHGGRRDRGFDFHGVANHRTVRTGELSEDDGVWGVERNGETEIGSEHKHRMLLSRHNACRRVVGFLRRVGFQRVVVGSVNNSGLVYGGHAFRTGSNQLRNSGTAS